MKLVRMILSSLFCLALVNAADSPTRPKITGVAHVAFFTADVAKTRAFYRDLLGYEEPYELKNPDGSLSMAFVKINDRQYVELSQEKEANSDRLNHVSIETDDIDGMRVYLASKGVTVPAQAGTVRIGNRAFNVKDPDGHTVEFVQYMPGGWTVHEKGKSVGSARVSDRMAHFGILVGNVNASMKFYRDILGFVETWRGAKDAARLDWINMRVPEGDDYIEFMLYSELPGQTKRGSQHHICLFVPDIEQAAKMIEERQASGVKYERPLEIKTGVNRKRQLNLFDPDGSRVELMEPRTVDGKATPSSSAPAPRGL